MENQSPKWIRRAWLIAGAGLILIGETICAYKVHVLSDAQQAVKKDYATVNDVTFGLLSVGQWRDKAASAVTHEIQDFRFTAQQRRDLQKDIGQLLQALIDHTDSLMNRPKKTIGGKLKKLAYHALVNKDSLKKRVPGYTKKIMDKLEQPANMARLKKVLESKTQQLQRQTFDSTEFTKRRALQQLLRKYNATDKLDFEKKTGVILQHLKGQTYDYTFGALGTILAILFVWWLIRRRQELYPALYAMSIISALILLLVGLTTTMIEVEARIADLHFELLGQPVSFKNQVLFFQSKSIIDVVILLIKTGKYDAVTVGVLILFFSVMFPLTKLICTGIFLLNPKKWGKNKFVAYFAFHSGKWSMADVMVVAIIMAYIGFNGIITSALQGLNIHSNTLTSITTNQTALQPGYIVFVAFVLYGLVLSEILKRITRYHSEAQTAQ